MIMFFLEIFKNFKLNNKKFILNLNKESHTNFEF
jgi:hypothetical protein